MKIIRWLLSHIFLILLIVVVIYGYMFWGNLAGEDTPAGKAIAYLSQEFVEVEEFVEAVKSKQAELADENIPAQTPVEKSAERAAVSVPAAPSAGTDRQMMQPLEEQPPVSISYSHNQMQVKQDSAGYIDSEPNRQQTAMASSVQATAAPAAISESKEKFVPAEVERQLSNVYEQGEEVDATETSNTVKESWVTARKSFYQRDYEKSIKSYQDVIANTKDNFDAYGELGNVYFNQGKNEQAAAAYYEAAAILIRKGEVRRVRGLIGLMRHLDKPKADELQSLINSASQS